MLRLIRFALLSMTPAQIIWTLLDMARLSEPLKRLMRVNLVRDARQGHGTPGALPPPEAFAPYAALFAANRLQDGSDPGSQDAVWHFNHQSIALDHAFLEAGLDKADYTLRMVFLHFEWAFATAPAQAAAQVAALHTRLAATPVYHHPSCLSQRVFVLAWLLAQPMPAQALRDLIRPWLARLIIATEDKAAANHRIDNDLAIALLAHMAGEARIAAWALDGLGRRTAAWRARGCYPEKTPCYQRLLAGRARILRACLTAAGPPAPAVLDDMIDVLDRSPDVHLNDSYLPRASWARAAPGPDCNYAARRDLGGGLIATVIADPLPDRGYRAHTHDAAGALFVHGGDGAQLIGGLGTPTYRISDQRDLARGAAAYAAPRPVQGFVPRLVPWMSFRHTAIRVPATQIHHNGPKTTVEIADAASQDYHARWTLEPGRISLWTARDSVLEFWSDPDTETLNTLMTFDGNIAAHMTGPSTRFDGIGHARPCTHHRLHVTGHLTITLTAGDND